MVLTKRLILIAYTNVLIITALTTLVIARTRSHEESQKRQQYFDRVGLSCVDDSKCGNGKCLPLKIFEPYGNKICMCDDGFTNYDGICDYQRAPQFNAFLASFFGGVVGADWFYLYRNGSNGGYPVAGVFKLLTLGMASVWWLVDWIRVLTMTFPDGNAMLLYENLTNNDL
eukprot:TRINITY_DN11550_c0_g1_i1.p1 TRINITY_DN11550_c0_g1~~TRINITY_DN11550_c0_g1_i1.p1  ORF type:complete len:171 (-),score=26.00 TRINITY_DN11550_c0_g1_i1:132-644(-)